MHLSYILVISFGIFVCEKNATYESFLTFNWKGHFFALIDRHQTALRSIPVTCQSGFAIAKQWV